MCALWSARTPLHTRCAHINQVVFAIIHTSDAAGRVAMACERDRRRIEQGAHDGSALLEQQPMATANQDNKTLL